MKKEIIMFLKEMLVRFKGESPKLFKRIGWICGIMAAIGLGLKTQGIDWIFYQSEKHPENVISLINILIGGGVVGSLISAITLKDTSKVEEIKNGQV